LPSKVFFYPDLQKRLPGFAAHHSFVRRICCHKTKNEKKVSLSRIHLREDAGKSIAMLIEIIRLEL